MTGISRNIKIFLLAAVLAVVGLPLAATADDGGRRASAKSAQQLWIAWGGTVEVRWNRDLASDLGLRISTPRDALRGLSPRARDRFRVRDSGSISFHVEGGYFRGFDGGWLQAAGGYRMHFADGGSVDYTDFRLVPNPTDPLRLDFIGDDDQVWFYIDRLMYELLDEDTVLSVGTMDMRISPLLARRIGHPEAADWPIADLALTADVQTQGSGAMPLATQPHWVGDPAPNGGRYEADLFMQIFSMYYTRCRACTGPQGDGEVVFTPSSTLKNNVNAGSALTTIPGQGALGTSTALWAASIPWYQKFSGDHAPHGNDQHPYLIWNMYRLNADGSIEQIGRSGVKHAWLTTNGGCLDPNDHDGHILGRGCSDTYSAGNNDTNSDLGPRSEVLPASGLWGRCGSIYDPNCTGSSTHSPNDNWEHRMIVRESQISAERHPGATYLFESWYVARDDINPYNSMATVTGAPNWTGSTWAPGGGSGYKLGPAIDRWVDPASPPANARSDELVTPEGRVKVAVKATELADGSWRYDYAVMNVDFARAQTSGAVPNLRVEGNAGFDAFSVPVPAGVRASVRPGRTGDIETGYAWRAQIDAGAARWSTDVDLASIDPWDYAQGILPQTLDWGTMYTFTLIAATPPEAGTATLHVGAGGAPDSYTVETLVPAAGAAPRQLGARR